MKIMFCLFLAAVAALSGCAVYTPSGAAVVFDPVGTVRQGGGGDGGGHFCPPGQAKKGNC